MFSKAHMILRVCRDAKMSRESMKAQRYRKLLIFFVVVTTSGDNSQSCTLSVSKVRGGRSEGTELI